MLQFFFIDNFRIYSSQQCIIKINIEFIYASQNWRIASHNSLLTKTYCFQPHKLFPFIKINCSRRHIFPRPQYGAMVRWSNTTAGMKCACAMCVDQTAALPEIISYFGCTHRNQPNNLFKQKCFPLCTKLTQRFSLISHNNNNQIRKRNEIETHWKLSKVINRSRIWVPWTLPNSSFDGVYVCANVFEYLFIIICSYKRIVEWLSFFVLLRCAQID